MRVRSRVVLVACVALSLVAGIASLSGSATARSTKTTLQRVIVVFKNQDQGQPASRSMLARRVASFRHSQAGVLSKLHAVRASRVHSYKVIDAVSATVSSGQVAALKSDPAVQEVIPDQLIPLGPVQPTSAGAASSGATPLPGACGPSGQVQLNPQAIGQMNVDSQNPNDTQTARALGLTGAGVKVAVIADGIDVNNPDLIRANGQRAVFDYEDFTGSGTSGPVPAGEGFIDVSSVVAQGRQVYDVSHYSDLPLNRPCKIRIEGVAPGASLAELTAFGSETGFNSAILEAIDYAVSVDHVNVLNESFGANLYPDDQASLDLIKQADENAVAAGVTVAVSTGDAGVTNTIGSPASDPNVISAGASTTYRLDAQIGYGGARFPGVTGWLSNNISSFSSAGFTQSGRTNDVVAPGELNWMLCTPTSAFQDCSNYAGQRSPVFASGGTSESAPLVAGVAALVIQAYRQTHNGVSPSPELVKQLIVSNTDDIGSPGNQQGTGIVDAYKAALAAEHYNNASGGATSPTAVISDSATQLNAVDPPATPERFTDTITNQSNSAENFTFRTRALGFQTLVKTARVNLSDASSNHIADWQGFTDNYEKVTFAVPYGQNRLSASIAYVNASLSDPAARVRLTLVDPNGNLASYDVPQGDGGFGNSQVTDPAPGTWTAYIYSRGSADGGTTGPVVFGARVSQYTTFGQVSPGSAHLAPGQSVALTVHIKTPPSPGDAAGAVVVSGTRGGQAQSTTTTIPITLRSVIPAGQSSFTGNTTGGNGRAFQTGQAFDYALTVPAGSPELNAYVTLSNNPDYPFGAWLVDPAGQVEAYASNSVQTSQGVVQLQGAQLHALNPVAGPWTIVLNFAPFTAGNQLSEQFSVATNQTAVPVSSGGLPDSAATQLPAGQKATYDVVVNNTGTAPELFFADARLPGSTQLNLGALAGSTTTEPLTVADNFPEYLVPTDSTQLTEDATTKGSAPLIFDSGAPAGDPDIISTTGTTAIAQTSGNPLSSGPWSVLPIEAGVFGATGGPTEAVDTSATVATSPFDSTVSSPTGDLEADSANPATSLGSFAPIVVDPGQTGTIPVTIDPAGASGTAVTGTLYVDDISNALFFVGFDPVGNQVAAMPYSYTIK